MKVEIRADSVTIEGYVNVTHRDSKPLQSESGFFVEQIESNAFSDALTRTDNVDLLFNHKEDRKLGSTSQGNLTLKEDSIGLLATCEIYDEEVIKEARAGNLKGWSFGMMVLKQRFEDVANQIQRRFVEKMELLEVSVLTVTPAYNALSLSVRSEMEMEKRFYEDEIVVKEDEKILKNTKKINEKVDEIMTPEERELLQKKAELAEQRSEEAHEQIKKIEEELKKINEAKKSEKEVKDVEDRFATMEYREAFVKNLVGRANSEQREMLESANGVIIPTTIQEQIERKLKEFSPIRGLARVITSASNMTIAIDAEGATATWVAEGALIPESNPHLGSVNINAHKLATMVRISNELIADSVVAIESYVADLIAEAIAEAEGDAFINGDGVARPLGLLNGVTPTAGETVDYDSFVNMYMSLTSPYRANASFLVSEDVYADMLKLKDTAGRPLMQVSTDGISGSPVSSILGKQVVVEPHLGAGLLVFADFNRAYVIVDRQGMTVRTLNELFAQNDMTAIMVTKRTDGNRLNADAMKVFDVGAVV